ncbi:sigma-70 family RNA polymerase sigma factor [Nostoc sp. 106C]|uniref:sigma-70 family RNA polymerase sigma factor n=1 Tax=Nostoc sp. 106C TaxID=1932667 RepID=UPI000A379364|nr:sigma-70 family RNA polymerase sigma factor [Nostoc sp. 106C]OUL32364.1 hypothetical protein BV375_09960 [Nostoc sp. 106C]
MNDKISTSSSDIQKEQKTVNDYVELIERVAQLEYTRLPKHLVDYSELVNIGAIAVHVLLTSNPDQEYKYTYLATAIRWAIRNELQHRYEWYTLKKSSDDDADALEDKQLIREAIYETVLSTEETHTPLGFEEAGQQEVNEIRELARNVREAIAKLPNQERQIVEARFYKKLRRQEIGESFYVSPLRILRMMQLGMDNIKTKVGGEDRKK